MRDDFEESSYTHEEVPSPEVILGRLARQGKLKSKLSAEQRRRHEVLMAMIGMNEQVKRDPAELYALIVNTTDPRGVDAPIDEAGRTALHWLLMRADKLKDVAVWDAVLAAGINPLVRDNAGRDCLEGVSQGMAELVAFYTLKNRPSVFHSPECLKRFRECGVVVATEASDEGAKAA